MSMKPLYCNSLHLIVYYNKIAENVTGLKLQHVSYDSKILAKEKYQVNRG
jgi:hypothetical protein